MRRSRGNTKGKPQANTKGKPKGNTTGRPKRNTKGNTRRSATTKGYGKGSGRSGRNRSGFKKVKSRSRRLYRLFRKNGGKGSTRRRRFPPGRSKGSIRKHGSRNRGSRRPRMRNPEGPGARRLARQSSFRKFRHRIAAVVTCRNEQETLPGVLRQLERLPLSEIIVVINGSTDRSLELATRFPKVTVVWHQHPLGHDVGRAVGARVTTADAILFMDGDLPVKAEKLLPFLRAADRGADLVLNDLSPYIGTFYEQDEVTWWKMFLNRVLGRPDLAMNSMTAIPHVVSRRLIDIVGIEQLAVPPVAHALALIHGLSVALPASVDVIHYNRVRSHNVGSGNPVAEMIIGDHLEAISLMTERFGARGALPDLSRKRHIAEGDDDAYERDYTVV